MRRRCACRLGSVGPTELWLDPTWLVLLPFLSWTLAVGYFPTNYPVFSPVLDWGLGLSGAVLLLCMVLLHELGHLVLGRLVGLARCRMLVFIFGAVAEPTSERAGLEALVGLAGPVLSLVLAGLTFWGALNTGPLSRPLEALLGYVSIVNVVLAVAHLIPGWPLDGGVMLQAALRRSGLSDRHATHLVIALGALTGVALIGAGIWQLWAQRVLLGVWCVLVGAVLLAAASSPRRLAERRSPAPGASDAPQQS